LLFVCCWLLVVFVFPTDNRQSAIGNVVLNFPFTLFTKEGQSLIFFPIRNQQPAISNVVIAPHLYPLPAGSVHYPHLLF